MNPVFTLNHPEFIIAKHLKDLFFKKNGYSVLIPVSSQQKGYDIALMRRQDGESKVVTFQVKSSTSHLGVAGIGKKNGLRKFANTLFFNRFEVQTEADFFILVGLYAPNPTSSKKSTGVWHPHILLFKHSEMSNLMNSARQRRVANPDKLAFGFDNKDEAFLTRGHAANLHPDYSEYLLARRDDLIEKFLAKQA